MLCGFLGAGKTTLLQRVLRDPQGVRFGVLVNDFGAIDVDAELLVEAGADRISLANGCVCCTVRDDLVDATRRLLDATPRPERIVVETSGVSRPLPVVDALLDGALAGEIALDAVVCLVDADGFGGLDYAATELAIEQAAGADLVLVNKCDIATAADVAEVESTLAGPLPDVRLLRTRFAEVAREVLFGPAPAGGPRARRSPRGADHDHAHDHDHDHHHGDEFEAWSWRSLAPLDEGALRATLRRLPPALLRAKGIVLLAGTPPRRAVLHLVGRRHALTVEDGAAPAESALVAITRRGALDAAALERLLDACVA